MFIQLVLEKNITPKKKKKKKKPLFDQIFWSENLLNDILLFSKITR